jgi:plastocyanin
MTKRLTPTLAICCAAFAFACTAAALDLGRDSVYAPAAVASPSGDATVAIQGFAFSSTTARPGATVEVWNRDGTEHTLTAADGSFDTKVISAGGRATFTAPLTPGTYRILCNIHPSMKGQLVVQ